MKASQLRKQLRGIRRRLRETGSKDFYTLCPDEDPPAEYRPGYDILFDRIPELDERCDGCAQLQKCIKGA